MWKEIAENAVTSKIECATTISSDGSNEWSERIEKNRERKGAKEIKQQHYAQTMKHRWYCVGTEKPQQKIHFTAEFSLHNNIQMLPIVHFIYLLP